MTRRQKLTSEKVLVRFFYYTDVNMGWGDGGTAGYAFVPRKFFQETANKDIKGGTFYSYIITNEGYELCHKNRTEHGWEFSTPERVQKEIEQLEATIAANNQLLENLKNV